MSFYGRRGRPEVLAGSPRPRYVHCVAEKGIVGPALSELNMSDPRGRGIACGGHWVVDRTKVIDHFPEENSLAMIEDETVGGGGCAYNVIIDLAKFDPELPLLAAGYIGADENGDYVLRDCGNYPNIDLRFLRRSSEERTAYTDAYTVRGGKSRTFFSFIGANRFFDADCVEFDHLDVWLFHLGYLTLFDRLDRKDPEFGRRSARFMSELRARGIHTSTDLVSLDRPDFADVVRPAIRFTDVLFCNDFEAEQLTGLKLRRAGKPSLRSLRKMSSRIFDAGLLRLLVVHFPEGAYGATVDGREVVQPSLELDKHLVVGTAGAGDAFCAGGLYALRKGLGLEAVIEAAVCAGGLNLFALTTTGAMGPWSKVCSLPLQYRFRSLDECFSE